LHPADAERAFRRRQEALEGQRPYDDTYRVRHPSGKVRILRDRGIVLRNDAGDAIHMVGHCVDVTETVRATQELGESEGRFRSLADHAPVLIWMADKNKRLTFCNRQWREFTGRTLKQEQGEGWALGVHPEERQRCMDAYEAAFAARQPFQIEFRLRRHDGQYCWMVNTGAPRVTEDGEFLGYVGTCVNITDLNEALQSLRITQFALDRAPDAVFWVRPNGRFVYVNDEACRALKYSASELLSLSVPDVDVLIPSPRWPAFWNRLKQEAVVKFDTRIRCKDGSEFPAELTVGLLETAAGEIACAFARDVTMRRKEQDALRASEERLELAVKGTRDGLWDWTVATNVVWFSDRNAEMLGYDPSEWPHTLEMFNKLLHPEDVDHTWAAVRRHFETNDPYDVEFRLQAKDGEYRWIRSRGIAIRDAEGNPVRMVGSHQDIQDRKEAQFALERSNEELRHFAYIAAHDLQEPLRAITGFCGLVEGRYKEQADETADPWIQRALEASERLQSLVKDLLVYSRVESRARPLEPVDMNRALEIALANLNEQIERAGATVQSDHLPTVPGYQLQLVQLLQNLVSNGIKYRAPGRAPEVYIRAEKAGTDWHFAVRDNGLGIPPESHAAVFDIFHRLHGHDEYPGTGLGLAICRKVVARHGGQIWIESDGSSGTVVKFTLPAASADDQ
jgi:PAS domain S-box-containing protein